MALDSFAMGPEVSQKLKVGLKPHLGVSENSVPLNPMVNDHNPY